ncbi:site-2 protease family protein [Candidatus Marsarchaeota archaeon]|nr:site-2 protease family protein [Candidatus Marsarchaeota archaeon]
MDKKNIPNIKFALVFIGTIMAIYGLYLLPYIGILIKLVVVLLLLIISGVMIKRIKGTAGGFGFYLIGTKAGIATVHKLARSHSAFWNAMATWGIILGFGLLSYFILGKQVSKKFYAASLASLMVIMVFVLPFISYSLAFIQSPQLQSLLPAGIHSLPSFTAYISSITSVPIYSEIIRLLALVGGFALFVIFALVYNASYIIYIFVLHPTVATLASQSAGATLALPGVTLPLFAGIVSLAIHISSITSVPIYSEIIRLLALVGGFALFVIFALVYNASYIIYIFVLHPTVATLASQSAGATLALPGVTLPLFAGIVSLAILLIIHEFSHGILSSISKVKLKQIGLLMFGIIPVGAFVEPDEKKVLALSKLKQNKISSAGVSANFMATGIFFILMVLTIPVIYSGYTTHGISYNTGIFIKNTTHGISYNTGIFIKNTSAGYPAYGVLKPGMRIISWNGHNITNVTELISAASSDFAGSRVNVVTNTGKYSFTAKALNATSNIGLIGVSLYESGKVVPSNAFWGIMYFIYSVFAISFMLNFLIGIMNLLPIPGFDGWRIFKLSISNKYAVNVLSAVVVLALLISLLPATTQL